MSPDRFDELLQRHLDGRLAADEALEFERELRDPGRLDVFLRACSLHLAIYDSMQTSSRSQNGQSELETKAGAKTKIPSSRWRFYLGAGIAASIVMALGLFWRFMAPGGDEKKEVAITTLVNPKGNWILLASNGLPRQDKEAPIKAMRADQHGSLYAACGASGMFHSRDGGANWEAFNRGLNETSIETLGLNGSGELLSGSNGNQGPTASSCCYLLSEGSDTWVSARLADSVRPGRVAAFCLDSKRRVLVSVEGAGIMRSDDGGRSYSLLANYPGDRKTVAVLRRNPKSNAIVAGNETEMFSSVNDGDSWQALPLMPNSKAVVLGFNQDGELFMTSRFYEKAAPALWRRTLHGELLASDSGLPRDAVVTSLTETEGCLFCLTSNLGVFASLDGGHRWHAANRGLPDFAIHCLAVDEQGSLYAGMRSGQVCRLDIAGIINPIRGETEKEKAPTEF